MNHVSRLQKVLLDFPKDGPFLSIKTADGVVKVHWNIITLFSPLMTRLTSNMSKHDDDVTVLIPDTTVSKINHVKNIISKGKSSLDTIEKKDVTDIIDDALLLGINIDNVVFFKTSIRKESIHEDASRISIDVEVNSYSIEKKNEIEGKKTAVSRTTTNTFDEFDSLDVASTSNASENIMECDEELKDAKNLKKNYFQVNKMTNKSEDQGHFIQCPHCNYETPGLNKSNMRVHIRFYHDKIYDHVCPLCGYKAIKNNILKQHILSVHENKKYSCSECGKELSSPGAVKKHIQTVHTAVEHHNCTECDYSTTNKNRLKTHINGQHNGIRYECEECGASYGMEASLKIHNQSKHDNVKHICNYCGKSFSAASSLIFHKKTKHVSQ